MRKPQRRCAAWVLLLTLGCLLPSVLRSSAIWAQAPQHPPGHEPSPRRPMRITMEELHRLGGVPPGWQFTLPEGDSQAGRDVFVMMQCYTCHTIAGEQFPPVPPSHRSPAPELTGIGSLHPPAYLAEAIVNPNAVVIDGPGYADADGFSIMPDYTEVLTLRQWLDLVAYLRSLRAPAADSPHGSGGHIRHPGPAPQQHTPSGHAPHPPAR